MGEGGRQQDVAWRAAGSAFLTCDAWVCWYLLCSAGASTNWLEIKYAVARLSCLGNPAGRQLMSVHKQIRRGASMGRGL